MSVKNVVAEHTCFFANCFRNYHQNLSSLTLASTTDGQSSLSPNKQASK